MATKLPPSVEYKMNPTDKSYLPSFPDGEPDKAAKAFNEILIEKTKYQKACSDAESNLYDHLLKIYAANGLRPHEF